MAKRTGGFIGQDGINAPDPATEVTGTAGNSQVDVSFTSPSDVGGAAITEYRVTDSTGAHTTSGSASPITVSGLTNGTSYTFNVWAINPFGWSTASDASGSFTPSIPYGIINGGFISTGAVNNISRFVFTTTGNPSDFGDLTTNSYQSGACASSTRGLRGGGQTTGSGNSDVNTIDYVTIASASNATDYGDLVATTRYGVGCSNSTRGLFWAGRNGSGTTSNVIQYVTIASTGNANDFGDMLANDYYGGAVASPTRGVHITGNAGDSNMQNMLRLLQRVTLRILETLVSQVPSTLGVCLLLQTARAVCFLVSCRNLFGLNLTSSNTSPSLLLETLLILGT